MSPETPGKHFPRSDDTREEGVTAKVVISNEENRWSGLYDMNGVKLFKAKNPVGFDTKAR